MRVVTIGFAVVVLLYLGCSYVGNYSPRNSTMPPDGSPEVSVRLDNPVKELAVLPTARIAAVTGSDELSIIDPSTAHTSRRKLTPGSWISYVALLPDGSAIVVAGNRDKADGHSEGLIQVWALDDGSLRKSFVIDTVFPYPLLLDRDGSHAYFPHDEAKIVKRDLRRIDLRSGAIEEVLGGKSHTALNVAQTLNFNT